MLISVQAGEKIGQAKLIGFFMQDISETFQMLLWLMNQGLGWKGAEHKYA